jgi:putative glycerol-1-phosphate prenyltransferase
MWPDQNWRHWRLIAKIDPEKLINDDILAVLKHPAFDAVVVGGTQGITLENTMRLIKRIRLSGYSGPLVQEISNPRAVAAGVDAYFIPFVINASEKKWFSDYYFEALKLYGGLINWDIVLMLGYIICNPDCAAGRVTGTGRVEVEDALVYAAMAEGIYSFPVLYIEYSGNFGDVALVKAVSAGRRRIHLVYGGGITNEAMAKAMAGCADTLVIGNIFYKDCVAARNIAQYIQASR